MASFLILNPASLTRPILSTAPRATFKHMHVATPSAIRFTGDNKKRRGSAVITGAGPSTSSYVFAFVFPLSLLVGTIITSIRIADKLDRDYLEELAINQAIMEAEEEDEDEDEDDAPIPLEEEAQPVLQGKRTRNRPQREA